MKPPIGRNDPFFVDEFRVDVANMGDEVSLSFRSEGVNATLSFTSDQAEDLSIELYTANRTAAKARLALDAVNKPDPNVVDKVTVVAEFGLLQSERAILLEIASTVREPQKLLLDRRLAKELLHALEGALETSGTAH